MIYDLLKDYPLHTKEDVDFRLQFKESEIRILPSMESFLSVITVYTGTGQSYSYKYVNKKNFRLMKMDKWVTCFVPILL